MIATFLEGILCIYLFYLSVLILSSSVVLTYELSTSIAMAGYHPTHMTTRVATVVCALVWDALLFAAAYILLLTALIDFDSISPS